MSNRTPIHIEREPQRLSDVVFDTLHKAILTGQLAPGEWLRQEPLAKELGVSQITIREALNRLASEGLCIRVPYKGVRVVSLSLESLEDIYTIRGLLEGLAVELATSRITAQELDKMRELLPATVVKADPASVETAREANYQFHEIPIRTSGRQFLIQILKQVWGWFDPLMVYARTLERDDGAQVRKRWGEADKIQHIQILEALEARDGQRARQATLNHVQGAWNNLRYELYDLDEKILF